MAARKKRTDSAKPHEACGHRVVAERYRAERILRETGNPWKALAELGIVGGRQGRRGRARQDHSNLANLYLWMMGEGDAVQPPYLRWERMDLLLDSASATLEAEHRGEEPPDAPLEAVFFPDCDVPMEPEDALRNVAHYLGCKRSWAWKILRDEQKRRMREGHAPFGLPVAFELPPRDGPRRR